MFYSSDASQNVSSSWSPPQAVTAETHKHNGDPLLLSIPPSPPKYNEIVRHSLPYEIPSFLKLIDIPKFSPTSSFDRTNNRTMLSVTSAGIQPESRLTSSAIYAQSTEYFSSASNSTLLGSTPSSSSQVLSSNTKNNTTRITATPIQSLMPRESLQAPTSSVNSYESSSTLPYEHFALHPASYKPTSANNIGSVWGIQSPNGTFDQYSNRSVKSLIAPATSGKILSSTATHISIDSSHKITEQIMPVSRSVMSSSLSHSNTIFGPTEPGISTNCSDLIRSMAAKYNNRVK